MEHACSPLWRLTGDSLARQNSRTFHASVECGMKMCSERKRMKWHFEVPFELILDQFWVHQNAQIIAFLVIRASVHCSFACYHHPVSCTDQPSATHPRFWQTCLFTILPKLWTTNRGWNIWENREKAGLSKRGMSCRRLVQTHQHAILISLLFCVRHAHHHWSRAGITLFNTAESVQTHVGNNISAKYPRRIL